jgi:sugar lactone lactonase YvrE
VAVDSGGNLYIVEKQNGRVRKVSPDGTISTILTRRGLQGMAVDNGGNLYFTTGPDHRVLKMRPGGAITTVAGTGTGGFSGDGGPAIAAELGYPQAVAVDAAGNLFIADSMNNRIRKVTVESPGTGQPPR